MRPVLIVIREGTKAVIMFISLDMNPGDYFL